MLIRDCMQNSNNSQYQLPELHAGKLNLNPIEIM